MSTEPSQAVVTATKDMPASERPRYDLEDIFTYHAPDEEQRRAYELIREGAKTFAAILLANSPSCADQAAAMRKLRECVMTANAAVARRGRP